MKIKTETDIFLVAYLFESMKNEPTLTRHYLADYMVLQVILSVFSIFCKIRDKSLECDKTLTKL